MEKRDYYRVTFGKGYDVWGEPIYYDTITFKTSSGERTVSMYAHFVDGTLRDVVTGMEIPSVLHTSVPGFGAYKLNLLFDSIGAYARMLQDVEASVDNIESYKDAIAQEKHWLDLDHDEYVRATRITTNDGEKAYNDKEFIESEKVKLIELKATASRLFGDE